MPTILRLIDRQLLTWAKMSITVLAVAVATSVPSALGNESTNFGFSNAKLQKAVYHNTDRQLACLARNVYYESRGEPMLGQMAVAQVTVNRARSGLFPKDICQVVQQTTVIDKETKVCQFAWYCNTDVNKNKKIASWETSYIAAKKVFLEGVKVASIDNQTLYFHETNIKVNPKWPHKVVSVIGNHVFYKKTKD
jgi:spore germination cell wall hydrolase CwlJ-like protein